MQILDIIQILFHIYYGKRILFFKFCKFGHYRNHFLHCFFFLSGMNIFVAFFVLLLLLAESTPKAAESVPLIGRFFHMYMYVMSC